MSHSLYLIIGRGQNAKILLFAVLLTTGALTINSQTSKESKLTGTIYDPQGSVIVGATVTANGLGKTFSTTSDINGVYTLTLPINLYDSTKRGFHAAKYDLTIEYKGFKPSEIKGFAFIPSQFGKMNLDIALDVASYAGSRSIGVTK